MFKDWTIDDWMNHLLFILAFAGLMFIWFGH